MIPIMQVGVHSTIGFFAISGMPTVAENACRLFAQNGVIADQRAFAAAARFARDFAAGLPQVPNDRIGRYFTTAHERIVEGVENPPASLVAVYKEYQASPSRVGMARYFDRLGDLLEEAHRKR